jgi:hypothetical protein
MRFEDVTAVKMSMLIFWAVTPCGLEGTVFRRNILPPSSDSMFYRNVAMYRQVDTALQPRRPTLTKTLAADNDSLKPWFLTWGTLPAVDSSEDRGCKARGTKIDLTKNYLHGLFKQ